MRAAMMVLSALTVAGCADDGMTWFSQAAAPGRGAVDHDAGLWVEAWPAQRASGLTPVLVRLENRGPHTLMIRNSDISLRAEGRDLAALPLLAPGAQPMASAPNLAFSSFGFSVAPHLAPAYPMIPPVGGPFIVDPQFYAAYYPAMLAAGGPTQNMLHQALPEGEVVAGGKVKGYLYFQDSGQASRGTLRITLIDRVSGEDHGSVSVPVGLAQ